MELGNIIFGNSRGIYKVPRGNSPDTWEWQEAFEKFLESVNVDSYGFFTDKTPRYLINNREGITTSTFEINPYNWTPSNDDEEQHNFIYYPTNYKLNWYKYPLRDSYANQNLTYEEFCEMLKNCREEYYDEVR